MHGGCTNSSIAITIIHGGQSGVDRGAHEAALDNGWHVAGYMPRDGRDEFGPIPLDVARYLTRHEKTSYAARTEANVNTSHAVLVMVRDADDPRATPGTTKTIDLAARRHLRRMIVDPTIDAVQVARWIWRDLLMLRTTLLLPLDGIERDPARMPTTRLLVAGPRESKWSSASAQTAALLRQIAVALAEIPKTNQNQDLPQERR